MPKIKFYNYRVPIIEITDIVLKFNNFMIGPGHIRIFRLLNIELNSNIIGRTIFPSAHLFCLGTFDNLLSGRVVGQHRYFIDYCL